jgi:ribosomal protein L7/L12
MDNREFVFQAAKKMSQAGEDIESILIYLKENGYSKTQSIVVIKEINNLCLGEAKELVHFSQAWKDKQEFDTDLNQRLYDALEEESL